MTGRGHGFSLVELVVVVAIVAILLVTGTPSFTAWLNDSRIRSASESIQNGLRTARNESSQRGTEVRFELTSATSASWQICQLDASQTACGGAKSIVLDSRTGVESGLIVAATALADKQGSKALAAAIAGGVPAGITFNALGRPYSVAGRSIGRIDVYGSKIPGRRLVILVSPGGMVRQCDPSAALAASDAQSCGTN